MRERLLLRRVADRKIGNIYDRPLVRRLVVDGLTGANGAWRRRWPQPKTRKPHFEVVRQ